MEEEETESSRLKKKILKENEDLYTNPDLLKKLAKIDRSYNDDNLSYIVNKLRSRDEIPPDQLRKIKKLFEIWKDRLKANEKEPEVFIDLSEELIKCDLIKWTGFQFFNPEDVNDNNKSTNSSFKPRPRSRNYSENETLGQPNQRPPTSGYNQNKLRHHAYTSPNKFDSSHSSFERNSNSNHHNHNKERKTRWDSNYGGVVSSRNSLDQKNTTSSMVQNKDKLVYVKTVNQISSKSPTKDIENVPTPQNAQEKGKVAVEVGKNASLSNENIEKQNQTQDGVTSPAPTLCVVYGGIKNRRQSIYQKAIPKVDIDNDQNKKLNVNRDPRLAIAVAINSEATQVASTSKQSTNPIEPRKASSSSTKNKQPAMTYVEYKRRREEEKEKEKKEAEAKRQRITQLSINKIDNVQKEKVPRPIEKPAVPAKKVVPPPPSPGSDSPLVPSSSSTSSNYTSTSTSIDSKTTTETIEMPIPPESIKVKHEPTGNESDETDVNDEFMDCKSECSDAAEGNLSENDTNAVDNNLDELMDRKSECSDAEENLSIAAGLSTSGYSSMQLHHTIKEEPVEINDVFENEEEPIIKSPKKEIKYETIDENCDGDASTDDEDILDAESEISDYEERVSAMEVANLIKNDEEFLNIFGKKLPKIKVRSDLEESTKRINEWLVNDCIEENSNHCFELPMSYDSDSDTTKGKDCFSPPTTFNEEEEEVEIRSYLPILKKI